MRVVSPRPLVAVGCLLLVAACADQGAVAAAPSTSAPPTVDLGGSSRVPHQAFAGEGEGYGTVIPTAVMAKGSMPGADHSGMGHASMPGMSQPPPSPGPRVAQAAHVQGTGTVNSVDAAGRKINLSHNAIPAIGWPAMTMDFAIAPSVDLRAIKPGSRVDFMMERGGDGMYVVHSISPAGGGQ